MRQSMRSTLAAVTPPARRILLGNLVSAVGSGVTLPFLIIYLGQVRGLGTPTAGLLVAYLALVALVCTPIVGTLVDRFGPRPVLMSGLAVTAVGVASLGWVSSMPTAIVALTVLGIGDSTLWAPQAALYARVTPREDRQKIFGLQFMCLNLGLSMGGILGGIVANIAEPTTFVVLYLVDAATFLVYLAILIPMRGIGHGHVGSDDDDEGGAQASGGYRQVLRDKAAVRLALGAVFLVTFGYGSLEVGLPVYITQVAGMDLSMVAIAYAVNAGSIVIGQLFVLSLIQRRSRSLLAGAVGVLWTVSWLVIAVSAIVPAALAAGMIIVGVLIFAVGETIYSPVAPAITNDIAPDHLRGRYNAMVSWTWAVSGVVGPGLAGLLLGGGFVGVWLGIVVLGLLSGAVLLASLRGILTPSQDGRT